MVTTPPRMATSIDYTRTCDSCSLYVPETERMNLVKFHREPDFSIGWYLGSETVNHLCDKCYFVERLEGHL